ncbi:MAG: glycosyltransferase family 4 protein [bacterium]|nr:glycosyltransferase family 4 protein [bacterium]
MKILFLVKFYPPYDRGGSEWSTRDLAKLMIAEGHEILVVTPNYGNKINETIDGINIYRLPFPIKLKNPKSKIAPFWTNNLLWFIYSSVYCLYFCIKTQIDIIHVHSNEFIPSAIATRTFLKKPTVVTFRDYQSLCSLGFCLWQKNKTCTISEFIKKDFIFFYKNYVTSKNPINYAGLLAASLRAMIMQKIIYIFSKKIDFKVAVSQKVAEIFKANGIYDVKVINNPVCVKVPIWNKSSNEILYVGKLSKGKGVDMFFKVILNLIKEMPNLKFKLIGSGYLEKQLKSQIEVNSAGSRIKLMGQLDHAETLNQIRKAALVVVPSIWPEPLPRSIIETIVSGTPVVATKVGGIPEIIKDKIYGVLSSPNEKSLTKAIIYGFDNRDRLKRNITKDMQKIQKHFSTDVVKDYIQVYKKAFNL